MWISLKPGLSSSPFIIAPPLQQSTVQEVAGLVHLAGGLGEDAWHERMGEFGSEVLPLIAERLRTARQTHRQKDELDIAYEKLIADLRWLWPVSSRAKAGRFATDDRGHKADDQPDLPGHAGKSTSNDR